MDKEEIIELIEHSDLSEEQLAEITDIIEDESVNIEERINNVIKKFDLSEETAGKIAELMEEHDLDEDDIRELLESEM